MKLNLAELKSVSVELSNYKKNRSEILISCINERLNKSLDTYYKTLTECLSRVARQNEIKLLKSIK